MYIGGVGYGSEILLLKYDKLITQSDGTSEANTTGYDLTSLNNEYFSPIKVDKLLLDSTDFSINIANKTSWSGGADTTSLFYTNGYWEDNEKNSRLLAYYSDSALPKDSTLKFKLSCGEIEKLEDKSISLYAYDNNVSRWIKVGFLSDMQTSKSNQKEGYDMMMFKLNSQLESSGDHNFTRVDGKGESEDDSNGDIPSKTLLAFGQELTNDGNISKLNLLLKKDNKCGCVCDMQIELTEARDTTGSRLYAPLNGDVKTKLLTFVEGWEAKITHPHKGERVYGYANSKIDISKEAKRKRFVSKEDNQTGEAEDTYKYYSLFQIHLKNNAEVGIDLKSKNDTFKITLNRGRYCAIKDVGLYTLVHDTNFHLKGYGFIYDEKSHNFIFEGNFKDHPIQINNSKVDWNKIVISVTGRDVICQGMWRVSLDITPSTAGIGTLNLLSVENSTNWKMDGMEFIVPYLNTDINYGTYIVITNISDKNADVYMDVFGDNQKNEGAAQNAYYTNIPLGVIPRRSTRIFFPKDLNKAILSYYPAFKAYRYLGHFLVTVEDENLIEAAAFQKDGKNGKRSIPVLTRSLQIETQDNNITATYSGHRFHE